MTAPAPESQMNAYVAAVVMAYVELPETPLSASLQAVSYTHLDVYKRQTLALPSQKSLVNPGLRASIMREQAGLSYMKEVLASNGPVRMS